MVTGIEQRIGVVLCGGQSSRMGRDKGLMKLGTVTWAERAASVLESFCSRIIFSVNAAQAESYDFGTTLVDDPAFADRGPLGGLLTAHRQFPGSDILLLACDMIFVEGEDIAPLLTPAEISAYRIGELFEPLCALYRASALRKLSDLMMASEFSGGLQKMLRLPQLKVAALTPRHPQRLTSQNTPYEYKA